jgi:CRISPR-associated endonuclease Csn1
MSSEPIGDYVLGLDLGTNSLGWAIIGLVDGEPHHLVRTGVRVFDAGMDGDIESGREESRNKARRDARLHRRQLWRHRRRLVKLARALQRANLLPEGEVSDPESRQDFFNRLDDEIFGNKKKDLPPSTWFAGKVNAGNYSEVRQVLPYILRAAALDEKLEPHYLGRAIFHLAQRRGFLSNRKQTAKKKDDDEGKVKEGIADLRKAMAASGARTLGEHFSRLKPNEERIRSRWTARDMYEKEFEAIWAAQAAHHPELLTEDRKNELRKAIFYQRPLWFDPNTIGTCELEPGERRAPAHLLTSQRFRLLQTVNNLKVLPPDDVEMPLTPADRKKVIDELETKGDRTFKQISKLLGLEKGYAFNLERGGEKTLKGNRTNSDFDDVFGERWLAMSPHERDQAVEYVHSFQKSDKLQAAAKKRFGLSEEAARKLAEISLEPDYMNLSCKAMEKLLPLLEAGFPYGTLAPRYAAISPEGAVKLLALVGGGTPFSEASRTVLGDPTHLSNEHGFLPPVQQVLEIRNPAVTRSLTELRKVVNAVMRSYGKPQEIYLELARDLKKSKKRRAAQADNMRDNEKARLKAAEEIIKADVGIVKPKPIDKRKYLLAVECQWECPYTGKAITPRTLFGPEPQFDIEHIIPFSRSMDNTFLNLTLCYLPENRSVKGNKTPYQAYSGDNQKYEDIRDRVKRFSAPWSAEKLKRFSMNDEELEKFLSDFRDRQLNDTAYASSLAKKYLGLLYGGEIDKESRRRVYARSGRATSDFRALWKLNSILGDGPTTGGGTFEKKRTDHRHHAIDATVIGLSSDSMIQRLSRAAQMTAESETRRKLFGSLEGPWPNFADSVRTEVGKIVVSHRVSKKLSGALHEETIYSRRFGEGEKSSVRVRKPLASLTKPELEDIADEGVKKLVLQKLEELGVSEPKKAFSNEANLPKFPQSGVLIKRVRLTKKTPTVTLGKGRSSREVTPGSNHHIEIFAELDEHGQEVEWDGDVVSMLRAFRRLKERKSVVRRDHGPHRLFKFSLARGEVIECDDKQRGRSLFVFRKVTQFTKGGIQIGFAPLTDARQAREMQVSRAWLWATPNTLEERHARKVNLNPLGEVSEAHD